MAAKRILNGGVLVAAADEGRLAVLEAMRGRLVQEIDRTADQRSLVLMMTRLQSVIAEIDEVRPDDGSCAADEIRQRRARRRASGA